MTEPMGETRTNRRLAAVLAADVVGYSRMMAKDEPGTLAALKRHREMIFDPAIAEHGGRIVKLMGDGTLAEFGSVVDALKCALTIQRAALPQGTETAPAIVLRIGVNLGDIIVDGTDIYGDGVNIAARLEPLAEPGGICIASIVHESVAGRIDAHFHDGGEVQFKNIDRPVRIWKWHPSGAGARSEGPARRPAERGILPSLAVLPFQNMSGEAEQEYFADGIVEDIITALSRFKSFAVIARNSSFAYKGRAVDVRQIARELGVHYILEGSVRRSGNKLRITAQLVDGPGGAHLWAEKFDGSVEDVFNVQDQITERVVAIVEPNIQRAEIERSRRERPESLAAYDLYLRALPKLAAMAPKDNAEAYALLSEAIAIQPDDGEMLSSAAMALTVRGAMGWPPLTPQDRDQCVSLTRSALAAAPGDAVVLSRGSLVLACNTEEYDLALAIARRAIEANPNALAALLFTGLTNLHVGDIEDALTYLHRAIALSPNDPMGFWPMTGISHIHMIKGNFKDALQWAERSLAINRYWNSTYWMLIAANAQLGHMDEARRFLNELNKLADGVTIAGMKAGQPAKDPTRLAAILEGLRMAGMAER